MEMYFSNFVKLSASMVALHEVLRIRGSFCLVLLFSACSFCCVLRDASSGSCHHNKSQPMESSKYNRETSSSPKIRHFFFHITRQDLVTWPCPASRRVQLKLLENRYWGKTKNYRLCHSFTRASVSIKIQKSLYTK